MPLRRPYLTLGEAPRRPGAGGSTMLFWLSVHTER